MKIYKLNKHPGFFWYALYPVGGHLFHYQSLARQIPVSLLGTTAQGLDDGLDPLPTVKTIAEDFVNSLQHKIEAINLIGYCFGALSCLEISRLIRVQNLILIDPILSYPLPHPEQHPDTPDSYHKVRINNREAGEFYVNNVIPEYLQNENKISNVENVLIIDRNTNNVANVIKSWINSNNVKAITLSDVDHLEIIKDNTVITLCNQFIKDTSYKLPI